MTRADEGDDVGADFILVEPGAGFGVLGFEQQGQQIVWRRMIRVGERVAAGRDDLVDGIAEKQQRGT